MAGGAVRIHPLHPSLRNKGNEKHKLNYTIDNKAEQNELEKSSSFYVEKDIVIESLLEALHLHRLRRKESDNYTLSHVTKLLHALSLEYKHRSLYDKAITCLNEALLLVQEEMTHLSDLQTDESKMNKSRSVTSSLNSSITSFSKLQSLHLPIYDVTQNVQSMPSTTIQLKSLLEEKSKFLSTLGNIFKAQKKMIDAIDSYADALLCLTNAGYPSESPPVSMVTRLIQRLQQPRPRDDQ
jgi:tetratricopeptide (TPR) repeat protein